MVRKPRQLPLEATADVSVDIAADAGLRIAGFDEVGRGCLAGPVYAAAVIFAPGAVPAGLRDSKKLTAAARERLVPLIEQAALAWAIGTASVDEIDRLNILQATGLAMSRACAALGPAPDLCRVDGNWRPPLPGRIETLVGGDDREPAIMAASILAKVARDARMSELHQQHPHYGWDRNRGYGTAAHLAGLRQHGVTAWHRRSFAPCALAEREFRARTEPGGGAA